MRIGIWSAIGLLVLAASFASAQEVVPYDGLRAGEEAHQLAEEQRQQRLSDQLYLNDAMRARYGWAPAGGSVVWYGNAGLGYGRGVGIDYAYANSSDRLFGRRGRGLYIDRYWSPTLSVFEPWPYVPGDIYGYYFPPLVRQPIGQRQIQTGPNRWESHTVYAEDLEPAAQPVVEPGRNTPSLRRSDGDEVEKELPPVKRQHRRAF